MTSFVFQPKPEGDRHVQIHVSYKRIIQAQKPKDSKSKNNEPIAAVLSVLEYLAKSTLENDKHWKPGDRIPDQIRIDEDCNFPRLDRLLDGWLKPTSVRDKLNELAGMGFISIDTASNRRRRFITYNYRTIANALAQLDLESENSHPPKDGPSKIWGVTLQNLGSHPPKSDDSSAFSPQNLDPSRSLDLLVDQKEDLDRDLSFSEQKIISGSQRSGNSISPVENPVKPKVTGGDQSSAANENDSQGLPSWQAVTESGRVVTDDFGRRAAAASESKPVPPSDLAPLFERGLGAIWKGPRSYHWSAAAIALAKARKRDLGQSDTDAAAQDYVSNLVINAQMSGNWAKVELFHDQTVERERRSEEQAKTPRYEALPMGAPPPPPKQPEEYASKELVLAAIREFRQRTAS